MAEIISREILNDEILVRFVFSRDFKKGRINENNIIDKDIYVDTRGGVSLQRERYSDENLCRRIAKGNVNGYVGFIIFRKSVFDELVIQHRDDRDDFLAEVNSTPLDVNLDVIPTNIDVFTDTPINPAHADLEYINPATVITDNSPHTFTRMFSKNLFKHSKLWIDPNPDSDEYEEQISFSKQI